jgi:hypothetical protein
MTLNKYGVPYHEYEIQLEDGTTKIIDIGCEEDWGDVQRIFRDNLCCAGWGNDSDGHIKIIRVFDCESGKELNPLEWAENFVWSYADNYCG